MKNPFYPQKYAYLILSFFFITITTQSCNFNKWVYLRSDNYVPAFDKNFSSYRGKNLCIGAPNASNWYYYSEYYWRTNYSGVPDLETLFTDCLKKSLAYIGMNICNPESFSGPPVMNIVLLSLSDEEFKIKVNLVGRGVSFSKEYVLKESPPDKNNMVKEHWLENLEQRAYRMVSKLIEEILSDQDFARIFFEEKKI